MNEAQVNMDFGQFPSDSDCEIRDEYSSMGGAAIVKGNLGVGRGGKSSVPP